MGSVTLVDCCADVSHPSFEADLRSVLAYAKAQSGVRHIVVPTTSLRKAAANIKLCADSADLVDVRCSVGIHPHRAVEYDAKTFDKSIRFMLRQENVVAIGETGLDFKLMFSPADRQTASFRAHAELACQTRRTLLVHERDAFGECVAVLDAFASRLPKVVIRCFTGTEAQLAEYVRRGFYVGITGVVAMKERGAALRTALANGVLPMDRLLVESGCPYMAPDGGAPMLSVPRRNEPCTLSLTVAAIAGAMNTTAEAVAAETTSNAAAVFGLHVLPPAIAIAPPPCAA